MKERRANAVVFGFDFQINAAIVLMIENIKELKSLRLEGDYEDIDIELCNGNHILAQAKAIVNSSTDFRNVRNNLKKALISLSDGSQRVKTEKLILITNSPNPLNENESRSIFWGTAHRDYNTLPDSSKKIINDYLEKIDHPLDTNQFVIQVIPFETDNDAERYKAVASVIDDFIGDLKVDIPGIRKQLHQIWRDEVLKNGVKKDAGITLSKNSLIWPIIVIATDIERNESDFTERFDSTVYDEIVHRYREIVDYCCERVEFFTKILYDYTLYNNPGKINDKASNFIEERWRNYLPEIGYDGMDSDISEALSKVVIYNVIRRRYVIERIRKGVNL